MVSLPLGALRQMWDPWITSCWLWCWGSLHIYGVGLSLKGLPLVIDVTGIYGALAL